MKIIEKHQLYSTLNSRFSIWYSVFWSVYQFMILLRWQKMYELSVGLASCWESRGIQINLCKQFEMFAGSQLKESGVMFNKILHLCQCALVCSHRKRQGSLKRDAVLLSPFILNHTPYWTLKKHLVTCVLEEGNCMWWRMGCLSTAGFVPSVFP